VCETKERPILFSAPMVRAILEGRKTVTRREIKPSMRSADTQFELHQQENGSWLPLHTLDESCMDEQGTEHPIKCPYGQPGDRLWVRETWAADAQLDAVAPRDLSQGEPILYPADGAIRTTGCAMISPGRYRPSIHMPCWASRILLEITDVRVERLQDISDAQIEAEGIDLEALADGQERYDMCHAGSGAGGRPTLLSAWSDLWQSINGPESWEANPWVWCVSFKQVSP
jgi:hypothetical protein